MHTGAPKRIDWIVSAGKGSESLFIGETEAEVVTLLGQPQSVSKYETHHYYLYPKLGLQVDFNPKTRKAKSLLFHRNGVNGYRQSPAETIEGLSPGAAKRAVLDALGKPDKTKTGTSAGDWFWYQRGIQFDFDEHGVVNVMIIFDPKLSFEELCL